MTAATRTEVEALRKAYLAHGFQPVPVYTRSKRPRGNDWQLFKGLPEFSDEAMSTGINTTGLWGVDVDVDERANADAVVAIIEDGLGPTDLIRERSDSPRVLMVYRAEGEPRKRKIELPCLGPGVDGKMQGVEFLGWHNQFVADGIHEEGQPYSWPNGSPETVDRDSLLVVTEEQVAEVERLLKARFPDPAPEPKPEPPPHDSDRGNGQDERATRWARAALEDECSRVARAPKGSRNVSLNAAAFALGQIVAGGGLAEGEVRARLIEAAMACGLWQDGRRDAEATIASGFTAGAKQPRMAPEPMPRWGQDRNGKDEARKPNGAGPEPWTFDPWAERPAPSFALEALPKEVHAWVEDRAVIMGADPTGLAMSALASLSGALSHAVRVKLKRYDDWYTGPLLWVMLVGDVSAMKTPIIRAASAPLRQLSAEADKIRREEIIRQLGADAFTRKLTAEEKKIVDAIPAAREFSINDTTVEALSDLLQNQDTGVVMVRDEVLGWIAQLERYAPGKGAGYDRACWLEAYNSGPYSIRRVHRGAVHVRRWSCSILGGVQPERLREAGNLAVDGLLARFLPVMIRKGGPDLDVPRDAAVRTSYTDLFVRLARATETVVLLSPEARRVREQLAADLHIMAQSPEPHFAAYVAKLPGVWGAVALILHMADVVGGRATATDAVSGETAQRASRIVDYCLDSGRIFYDWLADPTGEEAHRIAEVILKQEETEIDLRTFRQHKLPFAAEGPMAANKALELFVTGGWLMPKRPGPDNRHWTITPGLRERYSGAFAAYEARMADIRQRIDETAGRRRERGPPRQNVENVATRARVPIHG